MHGRLIAALSHHNVGALSAQVLSIILVSDMRITLLRIFLTKWESVQPFNLLGRLLQIVCFIVGLSFCGQHHLDFDLWHEALLLLLKLFKALFDAAKVVLGLLIV